MADTTTPAATVADGMNQNEHVTLPKCDSALRAEPAGQQGAFDKVLTDEQIIAAWDAQWRYHGHEPCKTGHLEFGRTVEVMVATRCRAEGGDTKQSAHGCHWPDCPHGHQCVHAKAGATPPAEVADSLPAPTYMKEDQAFEWAWTALKKDLNAERWTAGDEVQSWAFFKYGWDYRAQYERQHAAPYAARIKDLERELELSKKKLGLALKCDREKAERLQDLERELDLARGAYEGCARSLAIAEREQRAFLEHGTRSGESK